MDGWIYIDGWMDGWTDEWLHVYVDEWMAVYSTVHRKHYVTQKLVTAIVDYC